MSVLKQTRSAKAKPAAAGGAAAHHGPAKAGSSPRQKASKGRFPRKELVKFCRGMASMLRAQINTSDAIKYYAHGHPDPNIRKVLNQVRVAIDAGVPAYVAFAKTKRFDDKFVTLVRAGADSGQIHKAFASISHRLKKEGEFRGKIKKATLLPCIIITVLIGLFIVAQTKIVPQVEGLLNDVNQEPDPLSAKLFAVSHVVQAAWPFAVGGIIALVVVLILSEKFRNTVIYLLMARWRLLRQLIMGMRQMLFLGSLNMLHGNGIMLTKAIDIAAQSLKGTPMYYELIEAGRRYRSSGLPFSEALKKFTSCDSQVAHMVSIGERSSSLEAQLTLLTEMYEEDVDNMVNDFTAVMNVIVLLAACILISMVFIGAFLPIFLMGPKMMNSAM